jgi:hypothetical protein
MSHGGGGGLKRPEKSVTYYLNGPLEVGFYGGWEPVVRG